MRTGFAGGLLKPVFVALLLPISLAGCASLAGSPSRIVGANESVAIVNRYQIASALRAFDDNPDALSPHDTEKDLRHGLTREQYRNMVITVYLNAADARYHEWRSSVSDERRELGLGFDSSVIALTGVAGVTRSSWVRSLTAAAGIMAGIGGSVDRNVYFDRTLPGLLATMDARRLRVRTEIIRRFTDTAAEYPLATAFADISSYESAASLDQAIEDVTAQASEERQAAQREYNTAIHACHATEDLTANRQIIIDWVLDVATLDQLKGMAGLMGLSAEGEQGALQDRIEQGVHENYCSNAALQSLIASARGRAWGTGL